MRPYRRIAAAVGVVLLLISVGVVSLTAPITLWPATLPLKVEVTFGATTVDVFPAILAQEIRITYGAPNESSNVIPANISFELDNPDSHYTPDHPMGQYYPHVQLGVSVQVSVYWAGAWHIRFTGQASEWKPFWPFGDLSDEQRNRRGECRVTVVASGLLRQIAQGKSPLRSPLYRTMLGGLANDIPAVACWSMEDGSAATQFASAIPGAAPLAVVSPAELATDDQIAGSLPLPVFGVGAGAAGPIPAHTDTGVWYAQAVGLTDDFVSFTGFTVIRVELTGGTVAAIAAGYQFFGGSYLLSFAAFDAADVILDSGDDVLDIDPTGVPLSIVLGMEDDASGTDDYVYIRAMTGDGTIVGSLDHNIGPGAYGTGYFARPNGASQLHDNGIVGHFAYYTDPAFTLGVDDVQNAVAVSGHAGEQAHERIDRLCREAGVPVTIIGDSSPMMGPQQIDTLYNLINAAAQVDMGILYEDREALALAYRCLRTLYNQSPALTLNARRNEITGPFRPTLDDLGIRNDVTIERINGSEYRSIVETGPKSIQPAPDGVGVFDEKLMLNLNTDEQTQPNAKFRTLRGTWPGMRYPRISPDINAAPDIGEAWLETGIGDLMQVTELPPQHPVTAVEALVRGYTETLRPTSWDVVANAAPAGPYKVGVYGTSTVVSRYDSADSTLTTAVGAEATALSVTTAAGHSLWTTGSSAPKFPLDINVEGIRLRVTAISGSSSPQTFTVTRFVDGIDKPLNAGAAVQLWEPGRYAH